jgi:hypothetical protein
VGREGKQFFFEKSQENFVVMAYAAGDDRDSDVNVFCFFSLEKMALLAISRTLLLSPCPAYS